MMNRLVAGIVAVALAGAAAVGTAWADPDGNINNPQVGEGNHSVNVSIVNGVATVVVDGRQLYGNEAQPYIDAAKSKSKAARDAAFGRP